MSLLDGLKLEMKNPLAENNDEIDFVMESAFDIALEKETDKKLSEDDIEAILRGDDDIDPEEDDSSAALESALEALDNILSSSDVTDNSFATDLTSSDEEDDLDGGAEVKKADDDAAATEAAIIAECEAALEALNDSDIDRAGNVTNIKAVEGNEDPDVSEEDDEDDDMSLESLLDKCMKL